MVCVTAFFPNLSILYLIFGCYIYFKLFCGYLILYKSIFFFFELILLIAKCAPIESDRVLHIVEN